MSILDRYKLLLREEWNLEQKLEGLRKERVGLETMLDGRAPYETTSGSASTGPVRGRKKPSKVKNSAREALLAFFQAHSNEAFFIKDLTRHFTPAFTETNLRQQVWRLAKAGHLAKDVEGRFTISHAEVTHAPQGRPTRLLTTVVKTFLESRPNEEFQARQVATEIGEPVSNQIHTVLNNLTRGKNIEQTRPGWYRWNLKDKSQPSVTEAPKDHTEASQNFGDTETSVSFLKGESDNDTPIPGESV